MRQFGFLALLSVLCLVLVGCGQSRRDQVELARMKSILLQSRAYATDHGNDYPGSLAELHPKYINEVSTLYSPPQLESETERQPYYYRLGLRVGTKVDEPMVISPHVIKGRVNVGYVGGFTRQLSFEETQQIISAGDMNWVQTAPPYVEPGVRVEPKPVKAPSPPSGSVPIPPIPTNDPAETSSEPVASGQ